MANQLFGNNLKTTLSLSTAPDSLTPAALVFTLVSGGGNDWPTPSVSDYMLVTLYEVNGLGQEINHEVVKVTNRTADTFTIDTRDFENMHVGVGRSFPDVPANNPSGLVYAALRYTAYAAGNTLNRDDNLASVASVVTAKTNLGLENVDNTSNATERAATATLTNKTIALGSNTVSGTLAQFNTAVTDANLVSLTGTETLTGKTIVAASNTITTAVSGNLTSVELNAALAELQTDVDTRATSSALTTHTGLATDAHDATAISSIASGNLAATNVGAALNELQSDIDTRALNSALTTHTGLATGAHAASAISYAGGTGMAATDVEAAIDELATEKANAGANTDITSIKGLGAGTALLPTITPTGDTNTGVWFPAADVVAVSTGGSERLRIEANGNIAVQNYGTASVLSSNLFGGTIGAPTATPAVPVLNLLASTSSDGVNTFNTGQIYIGAESIPTAGSHPTIFSVSTTPSGSTSRVERMRIDSSGNVGIGLSSSSPLAIKTANDARVRFNNSGATQLTQIQSVNLDESAFAPLSIGGLTTVLETGGVERMRIDTNGNVGIGRTPTTDFDLYRASGTTYHTIANGSVSLQAYASTAVAAAVMGTTSNHSLTFIQNNSNRFILDAAGNSTHVSATGGLGYGTGAGGAVDQGIANPKNTTVTLNKPCGQITMGNAALAAGTSVEFVFNNSLVSATDTAVFTVKAGTAASGVSYIAYASGMAAGIVYVALRNLSGGSLSERVVLNYTIIKGATS